MKTKKKSKTEVVLLNIKLSLKERKLIRQMAERYAGGNLSAWLRAAGANYKPPKSLIIR